MIRRLTDSNPWASSTALDYHSSATLNTPEDKLHALPRMAKKNDIISELSDCSSSNYVLYICTLEHGCMWRDVPMRNSEIQFQ